MVFLRTQNKRNQLNLSTVTTGDHMVDIRRDAVTLILILEAPEVEVPAHTLRYQWTIIHKKK